MASTTEDNNVSFDLDGLEREDAPKPFRVKLAGKTYLLREPRELPWHQLINLSFAPDTILPAVVADAERDEFTAALGETPAWKVNKLAAAYSAHHGLPSAPEANASPAS